MSNFRAGQRIKKVRGIYGIGTCAVVVDAYPVNGQIRVLCDRPWQGTDATGRRGRIHPRTKPASTPPELWEPVIPEGAAPSELSYTELMDRLKAGEVECV